MRRPFPLHHLLKRLVAGEKVHILKRRRLVEHLMRRKIRGRFHVLFHEVSPLPEASPAAQITRHRIAQRKFTESLFAVATLANRRSKVEKLSQPSLAETCSASAKSIPLSIRSS